MIVKFLDKFYKDLDRIKDTALKSKLTKTIEQIETAKTLSEISGIKKMKGDKISYRIRLGDYRLGIYFENGIVEIVRFVNRKDIYKVFP